MGTSWKDGVSQIGKLRLLLWRPVEYNPRPSDKCGHPWLNRVIWRLFFSKRGVEGKKYLDQVQTVSLISQTSPQIYMLRMLSSLWLSQFPPQQEQPPFLWKYIICPTFPGNIFQFVLPTTHSIQGLVNPGIQQGHQGWSPIAPFIPKLRQVRQIVAIIFLFWSWQQRRHRFCYSFCPYPRGRGSDLTYACQNWVKRGRW